MSSRVYPLLFLLSASLPGCSKMDPQECTKLRDKSFELINPASVCTDVDCKPSEWPGCAKPVSAASFEKIHAMMDRFKKGKCEEKKPRNASRLRWSFAKRGSAPSATSRSKPPGGGMKIE